MTARPKHLGRWQPSSKMIMVRRQCAQAFGISEAELVARSRVLRFSHARQATAFVMRQRFRLSTPQVAAMLGLSCHTTVVHGCHKVAERMQRDSDLAAKVVTLLQGRDPIQHDAHVTTWLATFITALGKRPPVSAARPVFEDPELAEFIDLARIPCGQCDRAVLPSEAARCQARLCGLRQLAAA